MRIEYDKTAERPSSYVMKLSANDTYRWANRPGHKWPCSSTAGNRIAVYVDSNGIYDFTVNGRPDNANDIDGNELDAIIADHLPKRLRHLWPAWEGGK